MNRRLIIAGGISAGIGAAWLGFVFLHGVPASTRNEMRATVAPVAPAESVTAGAAPVTERAQEQSGSLWVKRLPKDAARHARRKELARQYGRQGASPQFIDRLVGGDVVGALKELKEQALSGDPTAIVAYGNFTYWNCLLHRSPEQLGSYAALQVQQSYTLPTAYAEWFREAFVDDIAFEKTIAAACSEVVDVEQALDLVDERARQGDAESLWLASMTANYLPERQRQLRAAAIAGSADAQFQIAFVVLGGHEPELLGTGSNALEVGDLLRSSAEQIPQAEGNLASCEFYGCTGIVADPAEGVRTALSAAEHGFFDTLLNIGPHLTPAQMDPTDVEAWRLIQASVDLQCGGSWSDAKAMKVTLDTLSSPMATDAARQRAEQLWAQYGAALGC